MRIAMQCAAILAACSVGMSAGAQSRNGDRVTKKEEKIVIRKDGGGRTVIELHDGAVFVNGEEVASLSETKDPNLRKKIVIENGSGRDDFRSFGFNNDDDATPERPEPDSRRAALGVFTDPDHKKPGAFIKDVSPGSAADKAGLRSGDVITKVDDRAIANAAELVDAIGKDHKPGDEVTLSYQRDGASRELKARLGESGPRTAMRGFRFGPEGGMNMPEMPEGMFRSFGFPSNEGAVAPKLGVSAEDRADGTGVRVLAVKPGSPAAQAGIREGDVLTRVDDDVIGSVDELQMSVRGHKAGDRLELSYERAGKPSSASVLLPKALKRKDL